MIPGAKKFAENEFVVNLLSVFCCLFAFSPLEPIRLNAEDWTQFRGNARDGKSEETGIKDWTAAPPKWIGTIKGAGEGFASLCVVDGLVYTTGNSDSTQFVVCLDLDGEKELWRKNILDALPNHAVAGSRSTPTYDDGLLYVVSSDGQIVCLDSRKNGEIVWKKSFQKDFDGRLMSGWGYSESPLVDGDKVIVTPGGPQAMVVALHKKTGETIWKTELDESRSPENNHGTVLRFGAGYSSLLKIEDNGLQPQYVAFVGTGLVGLDAENGKVLWQDHQSANRTANICMPVFESYTPPDEDKTGVPSRRIVYSSSSRGGTSVLDLQKVNNGTRASQKKLWKTDNHCCHHGGMILHDQHLFFASGKVSGSPTCLSIESSKVKWGGSFRGPGRGPAAVLYVDNKIIFRYQNGVVAMIAANGNKYQPLGHFRQKSKSNNRSWAYPVIVGKKLLLRENDEIMVYQLAAVTEESP